LPIPEQAAPHFGMMPPTDTEMISPGGSLSLSFDFFTAYEISSPHMKSHNIWLLLCKWRGDRPFKGNISSRRFNGARGRARRTITSSGFCYQDTGLKCLFKLNCAVEILGSKMPGVVSASSSAEAIGGGDRRAEFIIGRALAQPVGYSAPLAAAKVYFSLLKSASKLPKVGVRVIE
jgi:hypothetical protein